MPEPYLYIVCPLYLIALAAISMFLGWVEKKGTVPGPLLRVLRRASRRKSWDSPYFFSIFLVIISIFIYISRVTWVNIREYNYLSTSNTMLAVNDQLIWYMSKTGKAFSPMYGINYFFGHFKPILYFFAILYKIKPGPETLLFVQTLFLGLGAIPVYLLIKKKETVPIFSVLSYFFAISLISYTSFHAITLAIPFLLWGVYFMERGSARLSFIFVLLALSCKENVSFLVFALGIYILLFRKDLRIRKSLGYSLIIISLLWFYVAIYIIMPAFAAESNTQFLKAVNAIYSYLNPAALLKTLFSPDRLLYIFFLFLPFGFLPLFSPVSLIALPEILINTLSSNPSQSRIFNYYSGIIMAVFFLASLEAVSRKKRLSLYLLSFTFFTLLFFGPSPEYEIDRHSLIGRDFLKAVPRDASVYSQVGLASHLSRRERLNIYLVDYNYNKNRKFSLKDYDYAILDLKGDKFPDTNPSAGKYFARLKELIEEENMGLIKKEDGFLLLSRLNKSRPAPAIPMTWRSIFIEEPIISPALYAGGDIGLVEADFPSRSKQGGLFWLELKLVKLKEFSKMPQMKIEFRGKHQSLSIEPEAAHGILAPSQWREGEVLNHTDTLRFSPFLWPGIYEIFFSSDFSDSQPLAKEPFKIGEVLIRRR